MMSQIPILLDDKTTAVLVALAKQEYRDPRQQAAVMIRDALIKRGLMDKEKFSSQLLKSSQRQPKAKA